jgi:hypothetical protein
MRNEDKAIFLVRVLYKYNSFCFVEGLERGGRRREQKELCEWGCIFIEILVQLLSGPSLAEVEQGERELSC